MSELELSVACLEAELQRLVAALQSPDPRPLDNLHERYMAADASVNAALVGRTVLPESVRGPVGRIKRLHVLALHLASEGARSVALDLGHVRASRLVLGRRGDLGAGGPGETGIDCNLHG